MFWCQNCTFFYQKSQVIPVNAVFCLYLVQAQKHAGDVTYIPADGFISNTTAICREEEDHLQANINVNNAGFKCVRPQGSRQCFLVKIIQICYVTKQVKI